VDTDLPLGVGGFSGLNHFEEVFMSTPIVLITGALTGIGRATALAYAREGAKIRRSGAARIVIDIGAFWNGLPALRAGQLVCLMASVSPHPPRVI
jgi:NAD(P)-dependent dehydrogenase (short-subunit alcohol dehydrogenase family)